MKILDVYLEGATIKELESKLKGFKAALRKSMAGYGYGDVDQGEAIEIMIGGAERFIEFIETGKV